MVEFAKFTEQEENTVAAIVERAVALFRKFGVRRSRMDVRMDIGAVCAHTPLRLEELLNADDFEFSHDIGGIDKHLNRATGELENCFVPRFAKHDLPDPQTRCLFCHEVLPDYVDCEKPACVEALARARRRMGVGA